MIFNYQASHQYGTTSCAIDMGMLDQFRVAGFPVLAYLKKNGFRIDTCDFEAVLQKAINARFTYELGAKKTSRFSTTVDCSSLVKWFFQHFKINLPDYALKQFHIGEEIFSKEGLQTGDLLFFTGSYGSYYLTDPNIKVGHVGIFIERDEELGVKMFSARNSNHGVGFSMLSDLDSDIYRFCGIKRIIAKPAVVIITPPNDVIIDESTDLLMYLIRQWKDHKVDIKWPDKVCTISPLIQYT